MKKIAFVYPGQGSQEIGMGKDFYNEFLELRSFFDLPKDILSKDIKEIVFSGTDEELGKTEVTQPSIVMVSTAITQLLKEKGVTPDVVAGLSLGEYSALVASGAISYEECILLVRNRGLFMEKAVPDNKGGMYAVIGMEKEVIEEVVKENKKNGIIEIANYNCPGQIVISGEKDTLEKTVEGLKEKGAKRLVELNVSGPFHTTMLKEAENNLMEELKTVNISNPKIDMYFNVTASKENRSTEIKDLLKRQVVSSVLWENIIDKMLIEDNIEVFVEVGPGKTISSFIKKINKKHKKDITIYNIGTVEELNKFLEEYKN